VMCTTAALRGLGERWPGSAEHDKSHARHHRSRCRRGRERWMGTGRAHARNLYTQRTVLCCCAALNSGLMSLGHYRTRSTRGGTGKGNLPRTSPDAASGFKRAPREE
jgi:hypothetical protein